MAASIGFPDPAVARRARVAGTAFGPGKTLELRALPCERLQLSDGLPRAREGRWGKS